MLAGQRILLIIAGGIAAYKSIELIRRLRDAGAVVRCILTESASEFVTPMTIAALSGQPVFQDLFSLKDESEMGHIRLSREADLVVVAPATANLLAKMANGIADDLASTTLLATDKPVLVAPAMNVRMWHHAANQRNIARLQADGVTIVGPAEGPLADGESGLGRLVEPPVLLNAIATRLMALRHDLPLSGRRAIVTSGPTLEPIDPVRYITNRSSGKQGYAVAAALARSGAETILVSGPTSEAVPLGVELVAVETAGQMLQACLDALPAAVAVCVAAVADWRVDQVSQSKLKKQGSPPRLELKENPDILATLSRPGPRRPALVVGFAAETDDAEDNAERKRRHKGCDWILANSVAGGAVFGAATNKVTLLAPGGRENWPLLSKDEVAERLVRRIAAHLGAEAAPDMARKRS